MATQHDHLYALELADLGRGHPLMAIVYGLWDSYEPRLPEDEIDTDLYELMLWVAEIAESLDSKDVEKIEWFARQQMK